MRDQKPGGKACLKTNDWFFLSRRGLTRPYDERPRKSRHCGSKLVELSHSHLLDLEPTWRHKRISFRPLPIGQWAGLELQLIAPYIWSFFFPELLFLCSQGAALQRLRALCFFVLISSRLWTSKHFVFIASSHRITTCIIYCLSYVSCVIKFDVSHIHIHF